MDFSFTADQRMLRDSVRKALADTSIAGARSGAQDAGVAERAWKLATELGWPALLVPEQAGGLGLGMVEAVILGEEMGRALYTAPFRETAVLLPALLERLPAGQSAEYYQALVEGRLRVALALHEQNDDRPGLRCRVEGERLHGRKILVEHAPAASHFLVISSRSESRTALLVDADGSNVRTSARQSLDITCGLADAEFDGARVLLAVEMADDGTTSDLFDGPRLFNCAEMIGVAAYTLDMTVRYAGERKQFGQPIGGFQAVKHRLANTFVLLENAKTAAYYAAMALQDRLPDARFALDAAQALCAEMAVQVTSDCLQVHGGIGFTWEYDLHLYFKRARRLATFQGGSAEVYRRIARVLA